MPSRALISFGSQGHAALLDISRPLFEAYAKRHGYEYLEIPSPDIERMAQGRPHSWAWLPVLHEALDYYDEVIRVGADVVIVDGEEDIATQVPESAIMGMVVHDTPDGKVPNTDVSLLRRDMQPWLRDAWELRQYINHPWWEQAALLDLMGYNPAARPIYLRAQTWLYKQVAWLPLEWNSHESSNRHPNPRFAHVTYGDIAWRLPIMRAYAEKAVWVDPVY